jgi:hypothetical protein
VASASVLVIGCATIAARNVLEANASLILLDGLHDMRI